MRMLLSNFFYSVGITILIFLYQADPNSVVLGDFVRLAQSSLAQQLVLLITAVLIAIDFVLGAPWSLSKSSESANRANATSSGKGVLQ